jgi:RimJ/RimL family protein N-acetyltransferase
MTLLDHPANDVHAGAVAVLETRRLVLRAPRLGDARHVAVLANERRIAENTAGIPHPYGVDDAKQWISAAISQPGAFVITIGAEVIGACGLDGAQVGYWIGLPFWGCGYATEAARCLIDHAFGDLGYRILAASARISNPASRRVLEKCGFEWTGVGLCRIRAISSSVPVDRFRLERP